MSGIVQHLEQKIAEQQAELKHQQAQIEHLMGTCMKKAILLL
jgi:uncharacterized coiled-coil protein SlyX